MARNKVLERAKVSAPIGRNEFDVSCMRHFTAYAGYLNLVFAQPVLAGTHGRLNRSTFTRSADVVAPAFPSVSQHVDFFIVPIKSLWSYWENFKLNINDLKSSQLVPFDSNTGNPILTLPGYVPSYDFGVKVSSVSVTSAPERVFPVLGGETLAELKALSVKRNNMIRLCDAAGFGRIVADPVAPPASTTANVQNVLKLAAYQKCYFEHYRNTAYESNDPFAYNLDRISNNGLVHVGGIINENSAEGFHILQNLCTMRKVNYRNDYFHNIYPAINYVLSVPTGQFSVPADLQQVLSTFAQAGPRPNPPQYGPNGAVVTGQTASTSASGQQSTSFGITVQSIRVAFALDKLSRASAYAPKHVKEQWKAQFGIDIPEDGDMVSKRLGSFQNEIVFQEVTQMAPSVSGQLGDLGAKGIGNGRAGEDINFYATYDSIIIGVQYFMPRAIYDSFGLNIWNTYRARGDFYSRFFENLGLRPIYAKELDSLGYYRNSNFDPNTVIGFSVPNQVLKLGVDLNLGEFKENFVYYSPNDDQDNSVVSQTQSYLRSFTLHNTAVLKVIDGGYNMSAEYFKVSPEDLAHIFRTNVSDSHILGDFQFYGQLYIKMFISAAMGVHGQPSL